MHLWQGVLQHILAVCTVYVGCGGELTPQIRLKSVLK